MEKLGAKLLIDKHELAQLLGIPKRAAAKIINRVNYELKQEGRYVIETKTPKAPRQRVFELLGLEEEK